MCVYCSAGNLKLAAVLGGTVSSVAGELGAERACKSTSTSLAFFMLELCNSALQLINSMQEGIETATNSGHMKQMMLWYGRNCGGNIKHCQTHVNHSYQELDPKFKRRTRRRTMGGVLVDEMAIPPPSSSCRGPCPMDTPLTLACLLPPPTYKLNPLITTSSRPI